MIPLWMFPLAIVTGNTSIIKPSERDPGAMMLLAKYCKEIGLPPGVLNVVHGKKPTVDFLCDHEAIKAISFVGSDQAGKYIFHRGSANGKRVQVGRYSCLACIVLLSGLSLLLPPRPIWAPRTMALSSQTPTRTILLIASSGQHLGPRVNVAWPCRRSYLSANRRSGTLSTNYTAYDVSSCS